MAAWFDKAASQGLDNLGFPLTTFPISCGCWVNPTVVNSGTQCVMTISTRTSGNYVTLYVTAAGIWTVEKTTGGTVATAGTAIAGQWHYVLMRLISATSVRIAVLDPVGNVNLAGNNTTTGAVTSFDTFSLGDFRINSNAPTNFFGGGIGELFITNNDALNAGGQGGDANFFRRQAYGGPLSEPRIRSNLIEYRSFCSNPDLGHGDEILPGFRKAQDWTNTNGVVNGPHPPLPPDYGLIRPIPRLLTV